MNSRGANRSRLFLWQWGTVTLLTVGYAGYYLCRSNLAAISPMLLRSSPGAGINLNSIGLIGTVGTIAYAIGKIVNGVQSDFLGGRRLFLLGIIGSVVATVCFGFGSGLGIFVVTWTIGRFFGSMGWVGLVKIASRWFRYAEYGRAMAFLSLSFMLGNFVVKLFLGYLIEAGLNWRQVCFAAAGSLAAIGLICALGLRAGPSEIGEPEPETNPRNVFGEQGEETRPSGLVDLLLPLFKSPAFWIIVMLSFGLTLIRETFNAWTPMYLVKVGGFTAGRATQWSGLFDLSGSVSIIACGFMTDRLFGGRRGAVMTGALALSALALLGMTTLHSANPAALLAFVAAVGLLTIGPYSFLSGALSLDLGGKRGSGTAAGLIDSAGYVGGIVSGLGISAIATRYGWSHAFGLLTAVALASAATAVVYWRWLERPAARSEGGKHVGDARPP